MCNFGTKTLDSVLKALETLDRLRNETNWNLHKTSSEDQKSGILEWGYNGQSNQWFTSYGLLKLGQQKFIKYMS